VKASVARSSELIVESEYLQRFQGGLVFKAHRRCVSLNSRLESDKEEKEVPAFGFGLQG